MNMREVRELAKLRGARIGNMNKVDAVRMIQLTEGNMSCFAKSDAKDCDQEQCLFREDCVKLASQAH